MRKLFLLAAFLCSISAWGQSPPPDCSSGFCAGVGAPAFFCKAGNKYSQLDAPGTGWSCTGIPPHWVQDAGGGGAASSWQRLGVVIAPQPGDPMDSGAGHIQETSAIVSTSPELLTQYSKVKKYAFTNGWQPTSSGGSGMNVCFGEAADDITEPTRFPNCLVNHGRGYMAIDPTNGKYMLSAVNTSTSVLDIYENTTISALSQMVSPTFASVLACGGNGNEAGQIGAGVPIWDATHSLWRVIYSCVNSAGSLSYADWLATGSTLNALTKASPTPVIGFGSPAAIPNCEDCGVSQIFYVNGTLIAYGNGGPTGVVPTPYMYRFVDTTGIGNAWVADPQPFFQSKTSLEGLNYSQGQIGQPYLSPTLDGTGTVMNYAAYTNGCTGQAHCIYPSYEMAATIPLPLTTVLSTQTSDALPVTNPQFQAIGAPAVCNGSLPSYVNPPATPTSPGCQGFWSVNGGNYYFYDSTQSKWLQIAGSTSWVGITGSYVQGAGTINVASGTTLGQSIGTVAAGDLIVACVSGTFSPTSISDGTSTFTLTALKTVVGSPDTMYDQCGYLLSANAGAVTYTATWSGASINREFWVAEYHATGGTWHLVANAGGTSTSGVASTASSSGTFTPSSYAQVAIMDTKLEDVAATISSPLIGGNVPTEFTFSPINTYDRKYYLLNTSIASGTGNVTYGTATYWSNIVMAFGAF